jgi:hypothetical protein
MKGALRVIYDYVRILLAQNKKSQRSKVRTVELQATLWKIAQKRLAVLITF